MFEVKSILPERWPVAYPLLPWQTVQSAGDATAGLCFAWFPEKPPVVVFLITSSVGGML
jgi:uncharacterized membrane protein